MQVQTAAGQGLLISSPLDAEAIILTKLQEMTDLAVEMQLSGTIAYLACCRAMIDERHKTRRGRRV